MIKSQLLYQLSYAPKSPGNVGFQDCSLSTGFVVFAEVLQQVVREAFSYSHFPRPATSLFRIISRVGRPRGMVGKARTPFSLVMAAGLSLALYSI